jgi:selenocysteine lyase/cysteine desulfurase
MSDHAQDFFDFTPTIYLNCAYQGPFPRVTVQRIQQAIEMKNNPARMKSNHFFSIIETVRRRLADLVGADESEIAITNSATQGIGYVASGLDWKAGDEVVITAGNFPSNLFTWLHLRRLGVVVRVVRPVDSVIRVEDVAAALTSRTRVLALDWVEYTSGTHNDLEAMGEIAHRHGSIFVVDGTQGVGAMELNIHALPVDVLTVAAYKWLLAPYGTGFVYMTPAMQDRLDLQTINWLTVNGSEDFGSLPVDSFTLPRSARVFDVPATSSFLNLYGLDASLEFIQNVGVRTIAAHCTRLLDRLSTGAERQGFHLSITARERRSPILSFRADSLPATEIAYNRLEAEHVAVSLRHGMIRVSPHLYNSESDIDRVLSILDRS